MAREQPALALSFGSGSGFQRRYAALVTALGSLAVYRFTLIDAENAESLGVVAFARPDWKRGDVIPQGPGRALRVVQVWPADSEDQLPVLVVEVARAPG